MYKYNSLKAGQLPPQHLSFLENLLNFIITKYLKQACGLSITGDIQIAPNVTLSMMFTCCPNLMFLTFLWLEIYRFSNWSFCWLWAVQFDIYFAIFGQIKIDTTCSPFDKKIQESRIGSSTSNFQWTDQRDGIKNWVPQSINRLQ